MFQDLPDLCINKDIFELFGKNGKKVKVSRLRRVPDNIVHFPEAAETVPGVERADVMSKMYFIRSNPLQRSHKHYK